jgi:hypothetical protein
MKRAGWQIAADHEKREEAQNENEPSRKFSLKNHPIICPFCAGVCTWGLKPNSYPLDFGVVCGDCGETPWTAQNEDDPRKER